MLVFNLISLFLFACGAGILALQAPEIALSARVYPAVLIVLVALCCLVIAAKEIAGRAATAPLDAKLGKLLAAPLPSRIRLAAFLATWLAYSALLPAIGFIVATTCAIAVSLWLLRVRRVWLGIVTAAVFSVTFAVLFATVLYIPTPAGPLDELLTQAIYALRR
jgi:hypothetical protein